MVESDFGINQEIGTSRNVWSNERARIPSTTNGSELAHERACLTRDCNQTPPYEISLPVVPIMR